MTIDLASDFISWGMQLGEERGGLFCPFCSATHEKKFSVKRVQDGWLYNCFRAKCGAAGFVASNGGYSFEKPREELPKPNLHQPYPREEIDQLKELTYNDYEFFWNTWRVKPKENEVFVTKDDAYAFRIRGIDGMFKGWHVRQPRWKGIECHRLGAPGPKGLTYKDKESYNKLAYLGNKGADTLVIVEDYISAMKVAINRNLYVCALLGASMTPEAAQEIREWHFQEVIIWLDPDASSAAYKMLNKYGLYWNNPRVVTSPEDPKDLTWQQLKGVLYGYTV